MHPTLKINFTGDQLRALAEEIRRAGGDAAVITVEIRDSESGTVLNIDHTVPLRTIEVMIRQLDAVEKAARN